MELAPLARELVLVLDEDEGGGPRVDGHASLGVRGGEGPMFLPFSLLLFFRERPSAELDDKG